MLKSLKNIVLFILILLTPSILLAQLSLDGEFRPRSEYRNGYQLLRTPATEPAFFTSQRTRLSLNYESDLYKIKVSGQDVRVWGEVEQLQDNANVNIHEAWAQLYLSEVFQLKLGRQELVYDDQRLLGSVNWTQQARSHDALVLKYHDSDSNLQIDLGGAFNQEAQTLFNNPYTLNNYKVLSYLWMNKKISYLDISAIFLTDGFEHQSGGTNFRYTYGTHLLYNTQDWELSGSAYFQGGDDATRRNISASMFSLNATRSLGNVQLKTGFDYLSGGGINDADPARHAFHTLYATNHKFYGHMDYFLNIPRDTRGGGLQDVYLGTTFKVNEEASIGLTYHYLALANNIQNPLNTDEVSDKYLGSEIDWSFSYSFTDEIGFRMGYSTLFNSSSLDALQQRAGKYTQHWGWAMIMLTPQFLN
ncbi:alginate export family protein [Aliifodinibius salicampi]|uniref:Alginate export family protein n=1 Tax=Fodinibius salicampi TaxID=1920655 RepID=A0ABT3PXJ9_9BACT|nr:alginate export family protein [Fodinibius salicampi]MCW9712569.1 alginate export family protein [Fodinibius salicampi]